jgi:nitroreductase
MEFYEVIRNRRAVRKYKPDRVPEDLVYRILDAANWAPSGMNTQSWEFVVVSGAKLKSMGESLARIYEPMAAKMEADKREAYLNNVRNFFGAPLVIIALAPVQKKDVMRKMHLKGVCAAFENLLLAACAEGLGSCWMTGPLQEEAFLRELLSIGEDKEIVAVTPIGYPEYIPKAPPRLDPELKQKVTWFR